MAVGAPKGNRNSATGKDGRRALELALEHHGKKKAPKVISRIATLMKMWKPIIDKALVEGNLSAMKEINDRLDGRPRQCVTVSGDDKNPLITKIERVIVDTRDTDS